MGDPKPPATVDLTWEHGLAFTARDGTHTWTLDGRSEAGPSPVLALASALAGCMSIDLVVILTRGRHAVRGVSARLMGYRADDDPRRFVSIELGFTLDTDATDEHIQRAIDLSREKYCSVWHSMRADIALATTFTRTA
jgi:putative redox protein